MDSNLRDFQDRVARLDRSKRRRDPGLVLSFNHDGMVIARRRRHPGLTLPLRGLLLLCTAILGFKALAHAHLGAATYDLRIGALAGGSRAEQVAAWAMQADPLTLWLSARLGELGL